MFGPFTAYVRPYRIRILLGLVCIALAQAASARIPLLVGQAVNSLDLDATRETLLQGIRTYALLVVGLALVMALCNYVMRRLMGTAAVRLEYDIRTAYFAHLLTLPLAYFQTQLTGDLMSRATNDLNAVRIFFIYGVRGVFETTLTLLFSIALMLYLDWRLTLIILIPMPVFSFMIIRMAALVHTRFKAIQEFFGRISTFIQENLAGIRVVKSYVQGQAQLAAFEELNHAYLEKNNHLIRTHAAYRPLIYMIASIGLGLNLCFGGRAVINGTMAIGDFVAFNIYLTQFIRPIAYMGWVIDRFQRALVSMHRINEVLEVEPQIRNLPASSTADREITGQIQFRGLTFAYENGPNVLHDINLDLPAGTTLGILGRVGAGKTTLARLVPRLIQAAPGQVLIDGIPIEDWPLEKIRAAIGYVSQTPFLFSDSVRSNIAFGATEQEEELAKIIEAAQEAQLHQDIDTFEDGFDTVVGERGVTLSGGQKQRTTLARALIRRPRILILDDSLSAVDTQTEEAILGHLRRIMAGRTTLLIAHRISTLRHADRIIVLDEGRVSEAGSHQQLLQLDGFYADLYRRQQLAAELETL
jgi:ATP-binding cassette subfamily B multidrug efflux pump